MLRLCYYSERVFEKLTAPPSRFRCFSGSAPSRDLEAGCVFAFASVSIFIAFLTSRYSELRKIKILGVFRHGSAPIA